MGAPYAPGLLGLPDGDTGWLNDDRVGRALVSLFDADRASLLTERFGVGRGEQRRPDARDVGPCRR